jgi:predicted nucleotidyltransferase
MNTQIFENICTLKRQLLPNDRMILFGSQARGDARPDSDWDLLVLLNKNKKKFNEDYDNYAYPFAKLGLKYNALISIKLFTLKDWERQKPSIFYKNVEQEGIEIV